MRAPTKKYEQLIPIDILNFLWFVYIAIVLNYTISNSEKLRGVIMQSKAIGKNIKKYRHLRGLRQEDLAELMDLSPNFISMVERGEKTLSLDSFVRIANVLQVSADMLLADVLDTGYTLKSSLLTEQLESLDKKDREMILDAVETLLRHCK